MDSADTDDTGVFSPEASKRCSLNQIHRNNERDMSDSDGTNVFSPDVMQSRLVDSPISPGSKENTPSATETPVTKQLEDFDKKSVKRKRYFQDALNAQNLDDDSYEEFVVDGDSFDNFEKLVNNEKRAKRFRMSPEVPSNDSNADDMELGFSPSQEENQNKRKKRFVATSTQNNNDDSTYSDVFKSTSQGENVKRKSRFAPPSFVESDDSLVLSNVFKSSSKDKQRNAGFKVPKSPVASQNSERYSDVFKPISQDEKNKKRQPRFVFDRNLQDSCDNSGYSDILKSATKKKEVKRKNRFTIPSCSQDTEDSRQYSEVFESVPKSVIKTQRKNRFAEPSFQDCSDSLHYSDISIEQRNDKKNRFEVSVSQRTEDSLHYSDISIEQRDGKKFRFKDPVSQRTEDSLRYSDISIQQNDTTVGPNSQDKEESLQNSHVSIEKKENSFENTYDKELINCEKTSSSVATSIRSICIDTIGGSSLSIENDKNARQESRFENTSDKEQTKCEKTSSIVSTSVQSIYIDMVRSSLNVSELLSVTEEANKPFNQTYDVSTSAFCNRQDVSSLENVNMSNLDELNNHSIHQETFTVANDEPVISSLNASNERTLIGSQEDANQSVTLVESKDESSTVDESVPVTTDESKEESSTAHESILVPTDESKDENSSVNESVPVTTDESKNESSAVNESIPVTTDASKEESSAVEESSAESENQSSNAHESIPVSDESKTESFNEHESASVSGKSENESTTTTRKFVPTWEGIPDLTENFNDKYDKLVESNVTPAMSAHSIMIDTIPESSNATLPIEKIVEESVYVGFNPSSLMISVTEMVEQTSNSVNNNVSNRLEELPKSNDSQSGETLQAISLPPVLALNEENMKEHDYAMVHVTNAEEPVNELIVDPVSGPSGEEVLKESTPMEVITSDSGENAKEPVTVPVNILLSEETPQEPETRTEALASESASNNVPSAEETVKAQDEIPVDVPCTEIMPESSIMPPPNDEQISKKSPLSNTSLRKRKSRSSASKEQNTAVDLANLPPSSPTAQQPSANKSSASIPPSNVVEPHEESIASNATASKSNYSLRTRNSRSFVGKKSPEPVSTAAKKSPTPVPTVTRKSSSSVPTAARKSSTSVPTAARKSPAPVPSTSAFVPVQKSPEPMPSTSAAALNNDRLDDTGDALFNSSNAMNDIPSINVSEFPSQAASFYSRSRNSTSSQTLGSKSSVSVFSISKIGRRSSAAPKEFKVPQVPKVVPKKKKKTADPSLKHLPSRPNFPQFDFYCNKRFYDYLTSKMQPKYGIRTNNKAVELAKYISEVVKEVIAMKTGKHHILIEEMKKHLFKAGIVTTHYNFYMFCFDYLPPWFRRKAIPMMQPVGCPPNVEFDQSIVFNSIG